MVSGQRARRLVHEDATRAPQLHGALQRERLGELQRARIVSAVFDAMCERGAANVSVAHVVERSGVSRRILGWVVRADQGGSARAPALPR